MCVCVCVCVGHAHVEVCCQMYMTKIRGASLGLCIVSDRMVYYSMEYCM